MKKIVVVCIVFSLVFTVGCGKESTVTLMEGVFTKNGLDLNIQKEKQPTNVQQWIDGHRQQVTWHYQDGRVIFLEDKWRGGSRYDVNIDGQSWSGFEPLKPEVLVGGVVELGSLDDMPSINQPSEAGYDDVAVSRDGAYIAVASFDSRVHMYERSGKKIWDYQVHSGTPINVVFSPDNSIVFVGEASADANLYAFETTSGKMLWQHTFSGYIGYGTSANWRNRPKIRSISVTENMVVAAGEYIQRVVEKLGDRIVVTNPTQSIIVGFDLKTGIKRWQYPADGTMDTGVSKVVVSNDGQKVVFANNSGIKGQQRYPDGTIQVLNGQTGALAGLYQLGSENPYFKRVGINEGIDLSPNGCYMSIFIGDNRGMLFDLSELDMEKNTGNIKLIWKRQVSKVHEVSGILVYALGIIAHVTNEGNTFFMTSSTFLAERTFALAPTFMHSDATSLFAYDQFGNLLWKWQTQGGLTKTHFSADNRFMVAAIYHNYVTRNKELSGLYCLDLQAPSQNRLVWFYPTGGVAVASNIAADGTTVAGCESPLRLVDGTVAGEHRLHILK